jgi:hypothetical protein
MRLWQKGIPFEFTAAAWIEKIIMGVILPVFHPNFTD